MVRVRVRIRISEGGGIGAGSFSLWVRIWDMYRRCLAANQVVDI